MMKIYIKIKASAALNYRIKSSDIAQIYSNEIMVLYYKSDFLNVL